MARFTANGRAYELPAAPVVVVCVDGSAPAYHQAAVAAGLMPWLERTLRTGTSWPAHCAMPALTNPNNCGIATGLPASGHGISGNTWLDTETGEERPMGDPASLRVPTLFAAAEGAGLDVAVVTAKDKLPRILGAGLSTGTCVSAERAPAALLAATGLPQPEVYSAELSALVLAAGCVLLETRRPDLVYLSLSDYVQHKHAPGTPAAQDFYAVLDRWCARLEDAGAVVVLTADHGMSAKERIVYLEDEIVEPAHVVLPITDPYVAHHGALGSYAVVHLADGEDAAGVAARVARLPGVELALTRQEAADRLSLPADRIGDVVVLAHADTALGRTPQAHDLSGLDAPLRSHGALGEQDVPFVVNRRVERSAVPAQVHNYDAFWVGTTLVAQAEATLR
ncbi:phosphonoacetate hydrolase [Marmoricola endophyticus]|uniref:Phosphonoacetate hydrolase n=1 Tax=Marmoricola endophyticus TaxID=2040280 RepID=A0A917F821_9ACTN|nr:alkaline phosphatase family protein [Marmoricola endophyticus]GGF56896.1 phosphonoacetate hydrolase [Marmoricola endophyticus]